MHDFAWTTSPRLYRADARRSSTATCRRSAMRLLLQPEHVGQAERHFDATRAALKVLRRVVRRLSLRLHHDRRSRLAERCRRHGVPDALHRRHAVARAARRDRRPKASRSTKPGHQFWYGIVATNEFEHAWMDEGFNTFSTARAHRAGVRAELPRRSATSAGSFPGCSATSRSPRAVTATGWMATGSAAAARRAGHADVAVLAGHGRRDHLQQDRAVAEHARADARLGDAAAGHVDATSRAGQFKHPKPRGLLRRRQRGQRAGPHVVLRSGLPRLERVRLRRRHLHAASAMRRAAIRGEASQRRFAGQRRRRGTYRTTVVARRYGEALFPVDVRVVFENGEEVRWQWDGRDRWKLFEIDKPVRARSVQVDPERVLLLDVNYTNNSASLAADTRPRCRTQVVAGVADLAAGSSAHLRVLRMTRACDHDRRAFCGKGSGGSTARRPSSCGMFARHAARRAAALVRPARHDASAHRAQPRSRTRGRSASTTSGGRSSPRRRPASATTFVPTIVGFGAVLDNLSGLLDNQPLATTIAGVTSAWLVLWSFLSGGIIDRYARARPTRVARVLRRLRRALLALRSGSGSSLGRLRSPVRVACTRCSSRRSIRG